MSLKSSWNSAIHATSARHALWTAIGVTTLSLLSVTVRAEAPTASVRVSLEGLNLAKSADVRTAYAKLQRASRSVCERFDGRDLRTKRQNEQCYQVALRNAIESTGSASLGQLLDSDRNVRLAQRRTDTRHGT